MNARYYLPSVGRFVSADTIVPDSSNPQAFNRFSYVYNNPLKYIDPSGHYVAEEPANSTYCYPCVGSDGTVLTPPSAQYRTEDDLTRADEVLGRDSLTSSIDWAGEIILSHYLFGGGEDMIIVDNPYWTEYMNSNPILSAILLQLQQEWAQELYASGSDSMTINLAMPMKINNGEGVNGYQYLHGTNKEVGDFVITGTVTISSLADGGFQVDYELV